MSIKRRDILDSRARQILMNVNDYFEREKEQYKDILKTLVFLLKDSADETEAVIPRQLLLEITYCLKRYNSITECVVNATGVNKNTVCTVRGERAAAVASGSKMTSPVKKPRGKKQFLDSMGLSAMRDIIQSFYTAQEVPTLKKILTVAQRDIGYKGSISTLRRILISDLGYRLKKRKKCQEEDKDQMHIAQPTDIMTSL